jgi:hypothetical protein
VKEYVHVLSQQKDILLTILRQEIGVIVGGNLMVRHDAVEAFGNPIFVSNHDGRLEEYKELVAAAKAHGSLFISQLSHVGRQGGKALNPNPVSASDVQLMIKWAGNEFAKPRALEVDEIKEIVGNFADSAYWCWKAGYDGVQVSFSTASCSNVSANSEHRCHHSYFLPNVGIKTSKTGHRYRFLAQQPYDPRCATPPIFRD